MPRRSTKSSKAVVNPPPADSVLEESSTTAALPIEHSSLSIAARAQNFLNNPEAPKTTPTALQLYSECLSECELDPLSVLSAPTKRLWDWLSANNTKTELRTHLVKLQAATTFFIANSTDLRCWLEVSTNSPNDARRRPYVLRLRFHFKIWPWNFTDPPTLALSRRSLDSLIQLSSTGCSTETAIAALLEAVQLVRGHTVANFIGNKLSAAVVDCAIGIIKGSAASSPNPPQRASSLPVEEDEVNNSGSESESESGSESESSDESDQSSEPDDDSEEGSDRDEEVTIQVGRNNTQREELGDVTRLSEIEYTEINLAAPHCEEQDSELHKSSPNTVLNTSAFNIAATDFEEIPLPQPDFELDTIHLPHSDIPTAIELDLPTATEIGKSTAVEVDKSVAVGIHRLTTFGVNKSAAIEFGKLTAAGSPPSSHTMTVFKSPKELDDELLAFTQSELEAQSQWVITTIQNVHRIQGRLLAQRRLAFEIEDAATSSSTRIEELKKLVEVTTAALPIARKDHEDAKLALETVQQALSELRETDAPEDEIDDACAKITEALSHKRGMAIALSAKMSAVTVAKTSLTAYTTIHTPHAELKGLRKYEELREGVDELLERLKAVLLDPCRPSKRMRGE